jgi:hypothetical protein
VPEEAKLKANEYRPEGRNGEIERQVTHRRSRKLDQYYLGLRDYLGLREDGISPVCHFLRRKNHIFDIYGTYKIIMFMKQESIRTTVGHSGAPLPEIKGTGGGNWFFDS